VKKILLQTTIPFSADDWTIDRFSFVAEYLSSLTDESGTHIYRITARDRAKVAINDDPVLSTLDASDYDQLWLFGVDVGNGLSNNECKAIQGFRQRGGGVLTSRDHQDLGISFCSLGGIGAAHHFHSKNPETDPGRRRVDDTESPAISWPNYHSGSNGDFQRIVPAKPIHPLMQNDDNESGVIEMLPAHPHEGAVSVPANGENARVVAKGRSKYTGKEFNLVVVFESSPRTGTKGRAVADSSFHHFLDYNIDPTRGCPSFVTEKPGYGILENAQAMEDMKTYVRNLAAWLS
jgi:hypothetical protein